MPDPTPAPLKRHADNVNVTLLPGKTAVVHRVQYTGAEGKGTVLNVHKDIAAQLIKDGVARSA